MFLCSRLVRHCFVVRMFILVESLPNWYRSTRLWGVGRMNGEWLRVVGLGSCYFGSRVYTFLIRGNHKMMALWSRCCGVYVGVIIVHAWHCLVGVDCIQSQ